jgi:DNA helicase-2/ATP-dependent DNA helicase PcrA
MERHFVEAEQKKAEWEVSMTYEEFKTQYGISLNEQQQAAVQAVEGPVLLLAVPGSGKTTVLVTRLGYMVLGLGIPPEQILTMTYTVAATADMRNRFAALFGQELAGRLEFRTINGVSARIIQYYERSLGRQAFSLVTNDGELSGLVGEIYRRITGDFATESAVKSVRTWITYIKNMQLTEEEIDQLSDGENPIGPIYCAYCQTLRQQKKMDYDDQMVYAWQILRQHPSVLRHFQQRYPYLCVDEAQDTSKIQHQIIRLLAHGRENLFLVGDEDQSIYGFRAAYPEALLEFERVYPRAKVLLLEQNYRSTAQIVEVADRFIQRNRNRRPKHMRAVQGPGPKLRVIDVRDRVAQYAYLEKVAQTCQQEAAVLYRNNDSALPLIDRMERDGISYQCRQFDGSFFSHRVVRDVTDIIRFAYAPEDGELFLRIYYKLNAGISKMAAEWAAKGANGPILDRLAECPDLSQWSRTKCKALQTHLEQLRDDRANRAVGRIVRFMGYGDYLTSREADQSKLPILEALGVSEPTPLRLLERLEELANIVRQGSVQPERGLILSTIHSSKGLEYDRVFLMDVADDILPACPPVDMEREGGAALAAYEEERRIFYVGMTRARRELAVFRFQQPALHATFIEELFPQQTSAAAPTPRKPITVPTQSAADRQKIQQLASSFLPGDAVVHASFGRGKIIGKQGDIVSIQLEDGTLKRLALSVAIGQQKLTHA